MTGKKYSKNKIGLLGNEYTEHRDQSDRKIGESHLKEDILGGKFVEHRDADGNLTGTSEKKQDFLGSEYYQHRDPDHAKTGHSQHGKDFFENDIEAHFDSDGKRIGTSTKKQGLFGNTYTATTGAGISANGTGGGAVGGLAAATVAVPLFAIGGAGGLSFVFPLVVVVLGLYNLLPVTIAIWVPSYLGEKFRLPNFGMYFYWSMSFVGGLITSISAATNGDPWGIASWIIWIFVWPVGVVVALFLDNSGRDSITLMSLTLLAASLVALAISLIKKSKIAK